ncbi:type III secretion system inner membrane ring subunit SctD [Edwardsiella piscicida]|uniref:type III secretion system inner membrane ring subunit SctD n=1 Tax=Edwardsiella piscicida TaxID=1263550 RepID=UPI00084C8B39|nr:type III secretion system inner membrane ring subunit SctD [Edwardsiella piscicida]
METCFKLTLLNGPLRGQALRLPAGEFTLGEREESDLHLALESGGSASLSVSAQGVSLATPTACWVGGRPWHGDRLPLNQGIDLAGIHFALTDGASDTPLPQIAKRRAGRRATLLYLLLGALLPTLGIIGLLWPSAAPTPPSPRAWLPQALQNEPGLQAIWQSSGDLLLRGHCQESGRLAALRQRLQASGIHLQQEAVCNDTLRQALRALLNSYGYQNMIITLQDNGDAAIDGDFQGNSAPLAQALDRLPGLGRWQFTDSGAQTLSRLINALRAEGLLEGISARRTEHAWLLSGHIAPPQQARLNHLLQRLGQQGEGDTLPLRFIGIAGAFDAEDLLPAPIAGVGGADNALYLQLSNGMRLLPGAPLSQGMRIVQITASGVSLAGRLRLIFIPLHSR